MDLSPGWSVLLGGAIALAGSFGATMLSERYRQYSVKKDLNERKSFLSGSSLVKMVQFRAYLVSLNDALQSSLSEVPLESVDPGIKVVQLTGVDAELEKFTAFELDLAITTGDQGLVEKMLSVQWQTLNLRCIVIDFNSERASYKAFVEENGVPAKISGDIHGFEIPEGLKSVSDGKIGVLNQIVATLLERLPLAIDDCEKLIARFASAVGSLDGVAVPQVGVVK